MGEEEKTWEEKDRLRKQEENETFIKRLGAFARYIQLSLTRLAEIVKLADHTDGSIITATGMGIFQESNKLIMEQVERANKSEQMFMQLCSDTVEGMECLDSCDSWAHDENCPVTNVAVAWRQLREELRQKDERIRQLEAELKAKDIASTSDKGFGGRYLDD